MTPKRKELQNQEMGKSLLYPLPFFALVILEAVYQTLSSDL